MKWKMRNLQGLIYSKKSIMLNRIKSTSLMTECWLLKMTTCPNYSINSQIEHQFNQKKYSAHHFCKSQSQMWWQLHLVQRQLIQPKFSQLIFWEVINQHTCLIPSHLVKLLLLQDLQRVFRKMKWMPFTILNKHHLCSQLYPKSRILLDFSYGCLSMCWILLDGLSLMVLRCCHGSCLYMLVFQALSL